jgi:hypothetical protein
MPSIDRSGTPYQHTQVGTVILIAAAAGVLGAATALIVTARQPHGAHAAGSVPPLLFVPLVIALGAIGLVIFSRLTIRVDDSRLAWWFGPVVLRKSVSLADIVDATPVRNAWWYGWGIHLTPRGWLYNVSGLEGVEVTLQSGRRFRLGTDEPAALALAITTAQR